MLFLTFRTVSVNDMRHSMLRYKTDSVFDDAVSVGGYETLRPSRGQG